MFLSGYFRLRYVTLCNIFQVTRAKRLLVLVADRQTLQRSKAFKGFFKHIERSGEVK